ncbi:hypothetical protein [Streptomyces sp. G45]|uniref:hypothetical protein n=1 Tax=Streptomyces sp. G45 TaxID=3406627 RepID=UPI003C28ACB4
MLDMRGWAHRAHWIGCGRVGVPHRARLVVVIAPREDPAVAGFPQGASWAEKLRALTGWGPPPRPPLNWPAAEAELGTPLPGDYKEIVDAFGPGGFDGYVDLLVPGVPGCDLVGAAQDLPVPEGLLRWGTSEQELDLVWDARAPDPEEWAVRAGEFGAWKRFDCGLGEFLVRLLVDRAYGFPTSRLPAHVFESHDL